MNEEEIISYNIQKIGRQGAVVHRAEALPNNDNYCSAECGRWMDVDKYMVTTALVTCARCLYVLHEKEIDHAKEEEDE